MAYKRFPLFNLDTRHTERLKDKKIVCRKKKKKKEDAFTSLICVYVLGLVPEVIIFYFLFCQQKEMCDHFLFFLFLWNMQRKVKQTNG